MKSIVRALCILSFSALTVSASGNAFAECSTMNDEEWNALSGSMAAAYDAGDYEKALEHGKRLMLICNRSPVVNFTMSEIYRRSGNEAESDKLAKRATEYMVEYPVPQTLAERIWLRYAENELPYKKQLADLQVRMGKLVADQAVCKELQAKYDASSAAATERTTRNYEQLKESKRNWGMAMWSGVGVAVVGAGMTVTGVVLALKSAKVEKSGKPTEKKSGFAVTKPYVAGWALLGAGAAMTIGGTVLTGIAGYHYTHIDLDGDGKKDESVSFNVSPASLSFGLTF